MVVYVTPTIGGIWVKADSKERASLRALKAWWSTKADQRVDYKDHTMTIDQRFPCYAIFSLKRKEDAIKAFTAQMNKIDPNVEVREITTKRLLELVNAEDFRSAE